MMAESEELSWDRFMRLLAWESGDCERVADERGDEETDAEPDCGDGRPEALAAAARAALVIGM